MKRRSLFSKPVFKLIRLGKIGLIGALLLEEPLLLGQDTPIFLLKGRLFTLQGF